MVEFYRKIKNNVRGTILHMNIILLDHTEYADKFKDICHKFKTIVDVEVFETDSKFIDAALETDKIEKANAVFINTSIGDHDFISLVYEIKAKLEHTPIVYLSSKISRDLLKIYFIDPYLKPFAILPHPASEEAVLRILEQLLFLQSDGNRYFIVKNRKSMNMVLKTHDILYFESNKRKVLIHTLDDEYEMYTKIGNLQTSLPEFFLKPHNSFLINIHYVESYDASSVHMKKGITIPISNSCRKKFTEKIDLYFKSTKNDTLYI